jgi:hypothetical protein
MPEASSNAPSSTGTPSEAVETRADVWSLSPEEAGAVLAVRAADFSPAVPTAEQVQDVHDARLRLAALTADPIWAKKFMEGSIPERREFEALTEMIANEGDAPFVSAPIESTFGDQSVRRQDLISEISHLGKVGIPAEGIERTLTGNFSEADVEWAQRELERGMATKEWRDGVLAGDPTCVHEWTALCAVVAAGKTA